MGHGELSPGVLEDDCLELVGTLGDEGPVGEDPAVGLEIVYVGEYGGAGDEVFAFGQGDLEGDDCFGLDAGLVGEDPDTDGVNEGSCGLEDTLYVGEYGGTTGDVPGDPEAIGVDEDDLPFVQGVDFQEGVLAVGAVMGV